MGGGARGGQWGHTYRTSERMQVLSGHDGACGGFEAGSFMGAFEEKKKIQKLFIKPGKMVQ